MLPSVLELYIVWHPGDAEGEGFAGVISEYFKGTKFTGLISGAIEVYVRSEGWTKTTGAPRQIPSTESPPPNGIPTAKFTAVIPLLGLEMAKAVEKKKDDEIWNSPFTFLTNPPEGLMPLRSGEWLLISTDLAVTY